MADAFDNVLGQARVRAFLRTAVEKGRVSHAYLFAGPAGSNKTEAAIALAQAVLCTESEAKGVAGCTTCTTCKKIAKHTHPDVKILEPAGAKGYLIEQIRDIIQDTTLSPIQAKKKIYIFREVDAFNVQSANAFLKTLEEPPANVIVILLANSKEAVLPTIVSRCCVVPFASTPPSMACGMVVQNASCTQEQARAALQACDGVVRRAVEFVSSNERMEFRTKILQVLAGLYAADDIYVINSASEIVQNINLPLDTLRAKQEQELAENADCLAKSAIRQIEAKNKRQISAKTQQNLREVVSIVRSWLRDLAVVCEGAPELVANADVACALEKAARCTTSAHCMAAICACDACLHAFTYNVSPETCIDALLFEVRDALYDNKL